jgi:membrane fusion protein (multidrug efflux system)
MKEGSKKRSFKVYIPVGLVIIAIIAGAWYWYRDYSLYITSDDAHVDADNVTVSSKILGRVSMLFTDEGDTVASGMLLAALDSSDLIAQRNQVLALKGQALLNVIQAEKKYISDQQSLKVVEINLEKAKEDFERARKQSEGGVITQEQFDHIGKALEVAIAQDAAAKSLLEVSRAQIKSASAAVETSQAQIDVLNTQLKNTLLFSPVDGVVAKRWLLPGDVIQPGQSVFTITSIAEKWVSAYLEETKIDEIRNGQPVRFTIDAFDHVKFYGKVYLMGSTTASVFSLIPANNASGNFTKVTQRIPVRISIDSAGSGRKVSSYNILNGMSAVVKIKRR